MSKASFAQTISLAVAAIVLPVSSAMGQFYSMGRPPGEFSYTGVGGLSSDGQTAAGHLLENSQFLGFTWTVSEGRSDFGRQPGSPIEQMVSGLSGDGRYVLGGMPADSGGFNRQAFRWSESGGFEALGVPSGWASSFAMDINGDGSVIVGELHDGSGNFYQPFRWTASGGMQLIRNEGNLINAGVSAVSDDGSIVVGSNIGLSRAFSWTQSGGYQILAQVDGTTSASSNAYGISGNGRFIVGFAGAEAIGALWTPDGTVNLGKLDGYRGFRASEVSEDGLIVAGNSLSNVGPNAATVWTQAGGVQLLSDYLAQNGITLPLGVTLNSITGMSANGKTFAGIASVDGGGIGYVVSIPAPATACTLLGLLVFSRRKRN